MSKLGVNLKIDVTKIDKSKIFSANSGAKYIDLTVFIDPSEKDQYGNHGIITQSLTKDERESKVRAPILGNARVFWQGETQKAPEQPEESVNEKFDDDIPF